MTAVLPAVVVNAAYVGSVAGGHIPDCNPYVDGCTSISSAGRYGMAYWWFKAGMLPAAGLLVLFWITARDWLAWLDPGTATAGRWLTGLGGVSALFLVIYTLALGSDGELYRLMRRYGVTVYYSFSYLAQLVLLRQMMRLRASGIAALPGWQPAAKLAIAVVMLGTGLASIPVKNLISDVKQWENVIEWNLSLLMVSYYAVSWRAFRATGYAAPLFRSRNASGPPGGGPHR